VKEAKSKAKVLINEELWAEEEKKGGEAGGGEKMKEISCPSSSWPFSYPPWGDVIRGERDCLNILSPRSMRSRSPLEGNLTGVKS